MLGVFTAAVSEREDCAVQAIGGMTFGVGAALGEADGSRPRFGYFVNHDLAEYMFGSKLIFPNWTRFLPELDNRSNR